MAKTRKVRTPTGEAELIVPDSVRELSIAAMDRADAAAVVGSITTGRDLTSDVYAFGEGKNRVTGPTITGVRRVFLKTHTRPIVIEQVVMDRFLHNEQGAPPGAMVNRVMVRGRTHTGDGPEIGTIDQPEFMRRRDGTWVWDKHSISKASSMARRNLMKDLVKPDIMAAFVKACLANPKQVMQLTAEDARDEKGERSSFWHTQEARIWGLLSNIVNLNDPTQKDKVRAYIKREMGRGISEMNDDQIRQAASDINKAVKGIKKDDLKSVILGGE
jgi:hypothetical protein